VNKEHDEQSLGERVGGFLSRNRIFTALFFVGLVGVMTGILILDSVQGKKKVKSQVLSEDILDAYTDWLQNNPEERNADELERLIAEALDEYPRLFAAQRALFTRGLMALENEKWEEAASSFELVSKKWENSYLAPVSLYNAGAAREELGAIDEADRLWTHLVESYSGISPDVPEALFNLGRLAETYDKDTEKALKYYYELGSKFPDSRWTDLSKTRILMIESRF